jgi:small subunit ribosomal protein S8
MPVSDPIGDLLTRMRNAQHARRSECHAPWSRMKQGICELLKREGYLDDVRTEGDGVEKEVVAVFKSDRPELLLKRVSKPGARKYVGTGDIRKELHGSSLAIISSSHGLITQKEAREKKSGGELLCTVA